MPEDIKDISDGEEYEILPHNEIADLRKQLTELKKGGSTETRLLDSIDKLSKSIDSMMLMFKKASEEIKLEEHDQSVVGNQLGPMMQKMDLILSQNEKIAAAIINLAEMMQEKEEQIEKDIRREFSAGRQHPAQKPQQIAPPPLPNAQSQPAQQAGQNFPQMPDFSNSQFQMPPAQQWSPPGQQKQELTPLSPFPPARKRGLFGK